MRGVAAGSRRFGGPAVVTLAAVAIVGFAASPALAGAWVQEPGTVYARASLGVLDTGTRFDDRGDEIPFDTGGGFRDTGYRDVAGSLYLEAGVSRDWTVLADLLWKSLEASQPSAIFSTYGLADLRVGVRYGLRTRGSVVLAVSGMLSLPAGYDPDEYPALGSNTEDVALALEAGTSGELGWAAAEASYRLRAGSFRDHVAGALGGGFSVGRRIALRGESRASFPVGTERDVRDPRFDPNLVDPMHVEIAGVVSLRVTGALAFEAEARSTVAGENTLAGTRWSLAVATSPALRFARGTR